MTFASKEERDLVVQRLYAIDRQRFPHNDEDAPDERTRDLLREQYYVLLGEYADRLPRLPLSRCPFCGAVLKRVFDPYGLDGPWWHTEPTIRYEEPKACEHFQVLLGALWLRGRTPVEAVDEVQPGPEVPFVVPALLRLPGMIAVLARIPLATGDIAYPIAYFSDQTIDPRFLHQSWCRTTHWFPNETGSQSWTIANVPYAFGLAPFLASKQLRWCDPEESDGGVKTLDDGPCPWVDLPGDRERQIIAFGERDLMGLPNGELINPFAD